MDAFPAGLLALKLDVRRPFSIALESNYEYSGSMKTTIDIPDRELEELILHTTAKTKKEAVVRAVVDFNRRKRLARVARILGTFKDFMTSEELQKSRSAK